MFTDDDAMDDDGAGGQTRYPTMPSLVALQQMKNRMHLAFLGKKLMKWTTIATGKELRKIAQIMNESFVTYSQDFSRAFMLLARVRFYNPNLNTCVLNKVGNQAACYIELDHKSVAGVRVLTMDVIDRGFDPNVHFGIEKGGETILDAKNAWKDLLKMAILMLQERTAFRLLDEANKAANKKQNVLAKLVIPKIQKAIAYIKSELEEQEREETFRLKIFKKSKEKKLAAAKKLLAKPEKQEPCLLIDTTCLHEPDILEIEPICVKQKEPCVCCTTPPPELDVHCGEFVCPICRLADKNIEINIVPCKLCLPEVTEAKHRLSHLMAHVNQVLLISRQYNQSQNALEKGKPTNDGELCYSNVKQQLDYISYSTCTCPHTATKSETKPKPKPAEPDLPRGDSCTCIDPCVCDEDDTPSQQESSDNANEYIDTCEFNEPRYQTYNLCSIYGSSSVPQSSVNCRSFFKNTSKSYPPVPPFFYLYSGPYVHSETGMHPIQSKTANKYLLDAPYADELKHSKACPCKEVEIKKSCTCTAVSPQRMSKGLCTCDSTEILIPLVDQLPYHIPPVRHSEGLNCNDICSAYHPVASLHSPNRPTDLAKRITHLSEPCLKNKYSNNSCGSECERVNSKIATRSKTRVNVEPYNDLQIASQPIKKSTIDKNFCSSFTKRLANDGLRETQSWTCDTVSTKRSFEDLCTCDSSKTLQPSVVNISLSPSSLQSKATSLIFNEIMCKSCQPIASIPYPSFATELTSQISKESESYFKTNCSRDGVDANCDIKSKTFLKTEDYLTESSKQSCSCPSLEHKKSCSCKSGQSCSCGSFSSYSSKDISSSDKLCTNTTGAPYFKRSATFYTAIPQRFTSLISSIKEENVAQPNFHKTTDGCSTSAFNESVKQCLYLDPCVIQETDHESYKISKTSSNTDSNNKFISVQATYLLPYTREGKPGPCGIPGMSFVTYSLGNTVSSQSSIYVPYKVQEIPAHHEMDATHSTNFLPSYKGTLCAPSYINQVRDYFNNTDLQSSYVVPYTQEENVGTTSNSSSMTNILDGMNSAQYKSSSSVHIFGEDAKFSGTTKKSKKPNGTMCKDFSIYVTINPQDNSPYKAYAQQGRSSPTTNCETANKTDSPCASNSKNCSTYVTVIRKRPVPYTREGRPGPCGISEADHKTHFVISEDYTTYVTTILKRNKTSNPTTSSIATTSSRSDNSCKNCQECDTDNDDDEYSYLTTQDTSGPFNICQTCSVEEPHTTSKTKNNKSHSCVSKLKMCSTCDTDFDRNALATPYTREGVKGPSGVADGFEIQSTPNSLPTRENIQGQCCTSDTLEPYKHMNPYTREGIPSAWDVAKLNPPVTICIGRENVPSGLKECTQNGMQRACCISEECRKKDCSSKTATKKLIDPYTREGILGPSGVTESNINSNNGPHTSKLVSESYDKSKINRSEVLTGLGVNCKTNHVKEFVYNSDDCKYSVIGPSKCEGARKPYGISQTNHIAGYQCNMNIQPLLSVPYTREGVPGPCGVTEKNSVAGVSNTSSKTPSDTVRHNQGELTETCCTSKMKNHIVGFFCNMALKPLLEIGSYIPAPCSFVETNHISELPCRTLTKSYLDIKPYTREGMPGPCGISNKDHNSDSLNETLNSPSCVVPYTREGMSGPCGVATNGGNTQSSFVEKKVKYVEPYTREDRPGPTGIADSDLNDCSQQYKSSLPYCKPDRQLKACNMEFYKLPNKKGSKNVQKGIPRMCNLQTYRHGLRGPCCKDFTYCGAQSCMMCQVFTPPYNREVSPSHTANPNTKDAVTYVTLIPRITPCSRESVPISCGACDGKKAHNAAVSDNTSGRCCKARAAHIRINESRSLHSNSPGVCTTCRQPVTASAASSMVLPTYKLSMSRSTVPSVPCSCKSCMPSNATLECGTTCYQSERSINPKNCCSICGRSSSKKEVRKISNSNLISSNPANCCKFASSELPKSQPCSGCGKTKLVLSCASNPSVKSIAIGACTTPSAWPRPITKISKKPPRGHYGKPACSACFENKNDKNHDSHESDSSSEDGTLGSYPSIASEVLNKKKKKRKHMSESEFGYFETGYKIITKLCKYKNPDGTITDEKQTITIKTKKKCPQKVKDTSLETGTIISCSEENETDGKTQGHFDCESFKKSKSDVVQNNMGDMGASPKVRNCISTQDHQILKESVSIFKTCLGVNCTSSQKSLPSKFACDNQQIPKLKVPVCTNGPSCDCGMKTFQQPTGSESFNNPQGSESSSKCDSPDKLLCKLTTPLNVCGADNLYSDSSSECAGKQRQATTEPSYANRSVEREVEPNCVCTTGGTAVQPDSKCCNEEQDKQPKPTCKCSKRKKSEDTGLKNDLISVSAPKPICPGCVKEPIDSNPQCDAGDLFKPAGKVYDCATIRNSKPADAKSNQTCNSMNKSFPIPNTCIWPQNLSPKESTPKSADVLCANRLQDTDSGPKCGCPEQFEQKPASAEDFHTKSTDLTYNNILQDSAIGPKNGYAEQSAPESTDLICDYKLQNLNSGHKRDCADKIESEPMCGNRIQDTDSGEKCDCAKQSSFGFHPSECSCSCFSNSGCDPMCTKVASKLLPKLTTPSFAKTNRKCSGPEDNIIFLALTGDVSANKTKDSDSNLNCENVSKSLPEITSICVSHAEDETTTCANKLQDIDINPKCDFPSEPHSKPICANRIQDSDSGPKCDCDSKIPPKSTTPICTNRLEDTDSGPKCDCPDVPSKPNDPTFTNLFRTDQLQNRPTGDCNTTSSIADNATGTVIDLVHRPLLINLKVGPDNHPTNTQQKEGSEKESKLRDEKNSCNCKKKQQSLSHHNKKVGDSFHEEGRVVDLHNIKDSYKVISTNDQKSVPCCKSPSSSLLKSQCNDIRLQGDIGAVINLTRFEEKGVNKLPFTNPEQKDLHFSLQEESGKVLDLRKSKDSCNCETQNIDSHEKKEVCCVMSPSTKTEKKALGCSLHGDTGTQNKGVCQSSLEETVKVTDLQGVKYNCDGCENNLHRTKSNNESILKTKQVIPSLYGNTGIILPLNDAKEICDCDKALKNPCKPIEHKDIAVSTTDLCCSVPETNKIDPSNNCCTANKPSFFKGGSMIDALKQLFQNSNNSRTETQKNLTGKNICNACYSPPTATGSFAAISDLCKSCKEKIIDQNEQHYRCTSYNTEPGSTTSKGTQSPLCQNFCFLKPIVENKQTPLTPTATTACNRVDDSTSSISSDDKIALIKNNLRYIDAATIPRHRDLSTFLRAMKKGKIEHGCTKCGTTDGTSHSKHK